MRAPAQQATGQRPGRGCPGAMIRLNARLRHMDLDTTAVKYILLNVLSVRSTVVLVHCISSMVTCDACSSCLAPRPCRVQLPVLAWHLARRGSCSAPRPCLASGKTWLVFSPPSLLGIWQDVARVQLPVLAWHLARRGSCLAPRPCLASGKTWLVFSPLCHTINQMRFKLLYAGFETCFAPSTFMLRHCDL